jgi:hypothetical protein
MLSMEKSSTGKSWSRWAMGLAVLVLGCDPLAEPRGPAIREEIPVQLEQATTSVTSTQTLSWPSNLSTTGNLCRFGDTAAGNQVATNTRASGRLEESLTLRGLASRRITSIRVSASANTFKYDDVMLLAYNNHLVMASDRRVAEYSANTTSLGTSPILYTWSNILNKLIDNESIQPPWCGPSATACTVPPTETYGTIDVNIPNFRAVDEAAYPSAPDARTIRLVTMGDNDPDIDCRHGPVTVTITITHELVIQNPTQTYRTCRDAKVAVPTARSGWYRLDPCGNGQTNTYFCDMTTSHNGFVGGWTVAGWQEASARTTLGLQNRGVQTDTMPNWSRPLTCFSFTEAMVFNRTFNEQFIETMPAGTTFQLSAIPYALGQPGRSFNQGRYGPQSTTYTPITQGCVGYNYNGTLFADWACVTDGALGGTARGHIADYALDYNCVPAPAYNPNRAWAWANNTTCRHVGVDYLWGIAVR